MASTRLDRLLMLVEKGSTPATRKAAAQQIGEIQKYHPQDLQQLLCQVHTCLRSRTWDTRVAAACACEAIAKNVPQWEPNGGDAMQTEGAAGTTGKGGGKAAPVDVDLFRFETIEIEHVLDVAKPLLASSGDEYALSAELRKLDPRERLRLQRANIKTQLGLDETSGDVEHMFSAADLASAVDAETVQSLKRKADALEEKRQQDMAAQLAGMSARQRNQARREAQQKRRRTDQTAFGREAPAASAAAAQATKAHVTDQADSSKIVVESRIDATALFALETEWPFQARCEELTMDLFHHMWEVRHGACLGLRDLIKVHGRGAGRVCGASEEENGRRNRGWLDDMAIRLLYVIFLDQFGDYTTEQVVAPIRETAAQTLGAVLKCMCAEQVEEVLAVLLRVQSRRQWEVRHGSLLGVKYLVAVREDLVARLLMRLMPVIRKGLDDVDDDVRAASAEALLPICDSVVASHPDQVPVLLKILWESLLELDELSASTSSVMRLLASLVEHAARTAAGVEQTHAGQSLAELIPRLWPFFRHTLAPVRLAVVDTVSKLVQAADAGAAWLRPVLPMALTHTFQNFLLEEKPEVLTATNRLWELLVASLDPALLFEAAAVDAWLALLVTREGTELDRSVLVVSKHALQRDLADVRRDADTAKTSKKRKNQPRALAGGNPKVVLPAMVGGSSQAVNPDPQRVNRARVMAGVALGLLLARIHAIEEGSRVKRSVHALLEINSHLSRFCGLIIVEEWAHAAGPAAVPQRIHKAVQAMLTGKQVPFTELDALVASMRGCVHGLLVAYVKLGVAAELIEPLGLAANFTVDSAKSLAQTGLQWEQAFEQRANTDTCSARRIRLMSIIHTLETTYITAWDRINGAVAATVVALKQLPEKVKPVVMKLIKCIESEEDELLQLRAARAMARFIRLCYASGKTKTQDTVVKLIWGRLCKDTRATPSVSDEAIAQVDILTFHCLREEEREAEAQKQRSRKRKRTDDDDDGVAAAAVAAAAAEEAVLAVSVAVVAKRGAESTIKCLADEFGDDLFRALPKLWQNASEPLIKVTGDVKPMAFDPEQAAPDQAELQVAVNSMQLLETLAGVVSGPLSAQLLSLLPHLFIACQYPSAATRFKASVCLARLAATKSTQHAVLDRIATTVLPFLGDSRVDVRRQGAAEAIYHVVDALGMDIVPYIVVFVIPILGRMSDFNDSIRQLVSNTFATLIKLVPLESGIPNPPGMSAELIAQKERERRFLEQLLDSSKLEPYSLPVRIKAELRSYQQDGINWMYFLKKYQLHGILCDDMGLGKTLQTICMVAGDQHERAEEYAATGKLEAQPMPSLVVCPSTLTSHWKYEIEKFVDGLKICLYSGPAAHRRSLRDQVPTADIVILSYDVLRNEIEHFSAIHFNYCVLDEGHIIKNAKSKISRAARAIKANHRLILSGTPIQNNVLELWCLFDFLMPGFLGTEKQFNDRYGNPIKQSRDAKASSKDLESGALALDALHRQVLPFLLRRLKEDVLSDLPPKIIQDIYCDLSPLQLKLYEAATPSADKEHIFQALRYLRQVCNHPSLVLLPSHKLYKPLMHEVKKKGPPLDDIGHAAKLVALKQLLTDCGFGTSKVEGEDVANAVGQHRALIFCQQKSMLDILERQLLHEHLPDVTYLRMDGDLSGEARFALVTKFNEDPTIDLLLMTTKVGGLGLNLTGADTVIFLEHDWNPSNDLQAMDRAHRIGQKKVVNVYRLITKNTLEEKIMSLQKFKLHMSNTVISSDNSSLLSMGVDQVLNLFQVGDKDAGPAVDAAASKKEGETLSMGDVVQGLHELPDEQEYEQLDINNFLSNL